MATGEPSGPESMASAASFPRYEEMISAAIEALNDKNGCSKTAISDYMDSTYGDLPPAHLTLLSHHLDKMSQSGELTVLNNNYFKSAAAGAGATTTTPQKRGRGRPPKPKTTPPPGAVAGPPPPPRPRGRPPKSRDPFAAPPPPKKAKTASSSGRGRPRGRPPKKDKVDVAVVGPVAGTRRSRGRPPKVKPAVAAVGC